MAKTSGAKAKRRRAKRKEIPAKTLRIQIAVIFAKAVCRRCKSAAKGRWILSDSILRILFAAQGLQIDPHLFRFLIQVTAFQAKGFRGYAHVMLAALQFRKDYFA